MDREKRNNFDGTKLKEDIHYLAQEINKLACDICEIHNNTIAMKHDVSQTLTENYIINQREMISRPDSPSQPDPRRVRQPTSRYFNHYSSVRRIQYASLTVH